VGLREYGMGRVRVLPLYLAPNFRPTFKLPPTFVNANISLRS